MSGHRGKRKRQLNITAVSRLLPHELSIYAHSPVRLPASVEWEPGHEQLNPRAEPAATERLPVVTRAVAVTHDSQTVGTFVLGRIPVARPLPSAMTETTAAPSAISGSRHDESH